MTARRLSRQELIRRRRRSGLVGRQGEQAAFRDALQQSPEETTQFLFHIRGPAGVGKSTLVRQLESLARDAQALTAYIDESAADVVETMEAISSQFGQEGVELKGFDRLLTTYRQRRHEADASAGLAGASSESTGGSQGSDQQSPSPSSVIGSQLALAGLGMIPGVGAFTGALDPNQVATGADRLKALLSSRLRSHEDVELVLSPLQVLTPVFLRSLAEAADRRPWVVLFFDTYERTGPMLDAWLRDVLVSDRYGQIPANVLVVLAGQSGLDAQCWGDWLDLVTDLPLEVFTETEARQLLGTKGITDEKVIQVILELSERLPVLVSTLAQARPTSVTDVGDPSGTAVERFLKWETNSARRAAALACALPQELDEDTYRTVVDEEAREEFSWLRSMPFFIDRAGRGHYHDVVRSAMLRLQRQQSPQRWKEQHTRLADAFQQRRTQLEENPPPADDWWDDERWRSYRLQETYHRLCADYRTALPHALREVIDAHDHDITTLRRWAQTLTRAGQDSDAPTVRKWGQELLDAFESSHPGITALTLLLSRGSLETSGKCFAYLLRGYEHRRVNNYEQSLIDLTTALELEPTARGFRNRGETYRLAGRYEEALADFDRAIELEPLVAWAIESRGQTYQAMGRYDEALADLNRAIEVDPGYRWAVTSRGEAYRLAGRHEEALADFDRAIELDPDYAWAVASRGQTYQAMGRYDEALADFDRAIELEHDYAWAVASRGQTYQAMGRYDEALADFDRAIELEPGYGWPITNRGRAYQAMGRHEEALADFNRAIELDPGYAWPITNRGRTYQAMGRHDEALADFNRAIELEPHDPWPITNRGQTCVAMGRHEEALADFNRAIDLDPDYAWAVASRGETYQDMSRHEEALADFDRAIELDPNNAGSIANRSYIFRLMGRYDEALSDSNRAIDIDPDNSFALTNRGVIHRILGRYDESIADFDHAIQFDPTNSWTHYEKAVALYATQNSEYESLVRRTIELCSPSLGEQKPIATARAGNLFLVHCLTSQWTKAEQYLTAFLTSNPSRGQMSELLTVMETLRVIVPSIGEHFVSFRHHLEASLG